MSGEASGSEAVVLRAGAVGGDPAGVTATLTDAFVQVREAVEAGRPVVVVLAARDLMGQGDPLDAAVATGLLGMVRTFGIEGAKPGWRVNAVAGGEDDAAAVDATVATLAAAEHVTGQLLSVGGANLGKLPA
jgi:NAD(P)-dependent dehydrogenase (short-subunit alcohol dehydrogenase family)